jgi:hypothetical protein
MAGSLHPVRAWSVFDSDAGAPGGLLRDARHTSGSGRSFQRVLSFGTTSGPGSLFGSRIFCACRADGPISKSCSGEPVTPRMVIRNHGHTSLQRRDAIFTAHRLARPLIQFKTVLMGSLFLSSHNFAHKFFMRSSISLSSVSFFDTCLDTPRCRVPSWWALSEF